jgi:light-regulated signal transduction histidine kinase (bacteriophytochrome)
VQLYYIYIEEKKMSLSSVVAEELRGLNDDQIRSIYRIIKSFKKEKAKRNAGISLELQKTMAAKQEGKSRWTHAANRLKSEAFLKGHGEEVKKLTRDFREDFTL